MNDHGPQETPCRVLSWKGHKVSLLFGYLFLSHKPRCRLYPACSWGQHTASCFSAKLISKSKVRAAFSAAIAQASRIAFSSSLWPLCLLTLLQRGNCISYFCISTIISQTGTHNAFLTCRTFVTGCEGRLSFTIAKRQCRSVQTPIYSKRHYYHPLLHQVILFSKYTTDLNFLKFFLMFDFQQTLRHKQYESHIFNVVTRLKKSSTVSPCQNSLLMTFVF